ncbi:Rad1/Rec1/Rad17 [Phytophthora cactorum]|nr:Rad1/Rec1/Rad17 [Phytophthora cactorum]
MVWSSDDEVAASAVTSAAPLPTLTCTTESVKILVTLLSCLAHGKRDQRVRCDVDRRGMMFTAHSKGKSLQIKTSIGRELFESYKLGAGGPEATEQDEDEDDEDAVQLSFALNVNLLIECLSMFGPSALATTSLRMTYEPESASLLLVVEDSGVMCECSMQVLEHEGGDMGQLEFETAFEQSAVVARCIMQSEPLRDAFAELYDLPSAASVTIAMADADSRSPEDRSEAKCLSLSATSETGSCEIDFAPTSSAFIEFSCARQQRCAVVVVGVMDADSEESVGDASPTLLSINGRNEEDPKDEDQHVITFLDARLEELESRILASAREDESDDAQSDIVSERNKKKREALEKREDAPWVIAELPTQTTTPAYAALEAFQVKKWREILQLDSFVRSRIISSRKLDSKHKKAQRDQPRGEGHNAEGQEGEKTAARLALDRHLEKMQYCCERVFASSGCLELNDGDTIDADDVTLMFTRMMRNPATSHLVSARVSHSVINTFFTVLASLSSSRITYRVFKRLLQLPPLRTLVNHRMTPHTSVIDELSVPVYRDFVYRARRREHNRRVLRRLRYFNETKAARLCFHTWARNVRDRTAARSTVMFAYTITTRIKQRTAFGALHRHALASIAALEIQRVFRGMRGGCGQKRPGRVYRGRLGRIQARQKLLTHYYREMAAIQQEREAFRAFVRGEMARRLQRLFRKIAADKQHAQRAEEEQVKRKFELEMLKLSGDAVQQAARHRREVTERYDKLREEAEYREKRRRIDDIEKQKIVHRRRQREWEAFKAGKIARKETLKLLEKESYERLKSQWENTIAEQTRKRGERLAESRSRLLEKLGDEQEERLLAENAEERTARQKSALTIQGAFRLFTARKLLRGMLSEVYIKELDIETQAPRYRNTLTGKIRTQKPTGLGSDELEYERCWVIMIDNVLGKLMWTV